MRTYQPGSSDVVPRRFRAAARLGPESLATELAAHSRSAAQPHVLRWALESCGDPRVVRSLLRAAARFRHGAYLENAVRDVALWARTHAEPEVLAELARLDPRISPAQTIADAMAAWPIESVVMLLRTCLHEQPALGLAVIGWLPLRSVQRLNMTTLALSMDKVIELLCRVINGHLILRIPDVRSSSRLRAALRQAPPRIHVCLSLAQETTLPTTFRRQMLRLALDQCAATTVAWLLDSCTATNARQSVNVAGLLRDEDFAMMMASDDASIRANALMLMGEVQRRSGDQGEQRTQRT